MSPRRGYRIGDLVVPYQPWQRDFAAAKVTLSLRVLGRRPDGYHDLEALTVCADEPADFVFLARRRKPGFTVEVTPAGAAPDGDDNLAVRAAQALWSSLDTYGGLTIGLAKQIPVGAGLGGGSADAAAILRMLGREHRLGPDRLSEVAADLGSDVPFCLRGVPAWMRGRGEIVEPVDIGDAVRLVIAVPPFGCSTPDVYRAWDDLGGPANSREVPAPPGFAHLAAVLVNDLEPAAERVEPRLGEFRNHLERVLGRPALLCGSGSAYACWYDDDDEWQAAAARAEVGLGRARSWAATTVV